MRGVRVFGIVYLLFRIAWKCGSDLIMYVSGLYDFLVCTEARVQEGSLERFCFVSPEVLGCLL